jgi:hypothetical protein
MSVALANINPTFSLPACQLLASTVAKRLSEPQVSRRASKAPHQFFRFLNYHRESFPRKVTTDLRPKACPISDFADLPL